MKNVCVALTLAVAIALTGCTTAGSGGAAIPKSDTTARSTSISERGTSKKGLQKAKLRVLIPARHRRRAVRGARPNFVSPGTVAIESVVNPSTDDIVNIADVSPGSDSCGAPLADGSRICTVVVDAPPGNDTFVFSAWDQIVADTIPAEAKQLGTATMTQTINADAYNTLDVYISGIVASFEAMPDFASLPAYGNPNTFAFTIYADDADGERITATNGGAGASDPYANGGINAKLDAAGSADATLSVNGAAGGSSAQVLYSSDKLVLKYDGNASPGYSALVTISAQNVTPASVRISPLFVSSANPAFGAGTPYVLNLYLGVTANLKISEAGAPAGTTYSAAASAGCAGVATLQQTAPMFIRVGASSKAGKSCSVSVTDGTSTDAIAVTNTTGSGTVTTPKFTSYATT
ncbi:MAG TPA: hypothetical protein VK760_04190, partial [Candidatus Acidoferrales bacterium]|nr:hypothetical protein [Candidatus Acidoferrales bacterium]